MYRFDTIYGAQMIVAANEALSMISGKTLHDLKEDRMLSLVNSGDITLIWGNSGNSIPISRRKKTLICILSMELSGIVLYALKYVF